MMMLKKYFLHSLLGLGLGAVLCWVLIGHTDLTAPMVVALRDGFNPALMIVIVLVSMLMIETGARKWSYLDRTFDGQAAKPHRFYLRHFIWQNWLAQILPSTVALIAGRALVTHTTEARNWRRGLRSGLIDQLSELLVIVAFIPATLWQLAGWGQLAAGGGWVEWLLLGMATLGAVTWSGHKIWPRYVLPVVVAWSSVRIVLITWRLILGAQVFGLPITAAIIAFATPLATLTVLIPLTPGNLGLAEWGWTYALSLWHIDHALAALYALSFRILVLVMQSLLLCGLPLLRAR